MRPDLLEFIGPLPPPVHGFAWVNQQMLKGLMKRIQVKVYNRAPKRWIFIGHSKALDALFALWQCLVSIWNFAIARPAAVYICCSGGLGMLLDAIFVLIARCMRAPIYVHHHAFSYLNAPTLIARLCMAQLRSSQHIVLGEQMAQLLSEVHAVPNSNISILSNAAFLVPQSNLPSSGRSKMTVGFLSNITVDKGIFDFFDLAENFHRTGSSVRFLIAGPVVPDIQSAFNVRLGLLPNVQHLGALYGEEKTQFFNSLDVLAFPTRYANEAEPVTIHEALRAGVAVIANDRGCISSQLDETCGRVILKADDFVNAATTWLTKLSESNEMLMSYKLAAQSRFKSMHEKNAQNLERILDRIAAGRSLQEMT